MPAHLSLFEDIEQSVYSMMSFVIFVLFSMVGW